MLSYSLIENVLTPAPDDCTAVPQNVRSYTMDEILDMMMERGTTITRTDVKAVLQLYKEVVASLVADGSAVNTELMNVSPGISGAYHIRRLVTKRNENAQNRTLRQTRSYRRSKIISISTDTKREA